MMIQLRSQPEPMDLPAACWLDQWLEIDELRGAVAAAPNPMRFVIVEHYWGGRGLRSLAHELQESESRIAELLALGREWLRCELMPEKSPNQPGFSLSSRYGDRHVP